VVRLPALPVLLCAACTAQLLDIDPPLEPPPLILPGAQCDEFAAPLCIDQKTALFCAASGVWQPREPCAYLCRDGFCTGGCEPGASRCNEDGGIDRCDADGRFQSESTCSFVCVGAGKCDGECRPGERACSSAAERLECSDRGRWQPVACNDQTCVRGECTGDCAQGQVRCASGEPALEVCDELGHWAEGGACDFVCEAPGRCAGECRPGSKACPSVTELGECDEGGRWTVRLCVGQACSEGACTGDCSPGAQGCDRADVVHCSDTGQWAPADAPCVEPETICSLSDGTASCVPNEPTTLGIATAEATPTGEFGPELVYLMSLETRDVPVQVDAFGIVAPAEQSLIVQMGIYTSSDDDPAFIAVLVALTDLFVVEPGGVEQEFSECLVLEAGRRHWLAVHVLTPAPWWTLQAAGTEVIQVGQTDESGFPSAIEIDAVRREGVGLSIFARVRTRFTPCT
jgi:hypothetical protein